MPTNMSLGLSLTSQRGTNIPMRKFVLNTPKISEDIQVLETATNIYVKSNGYAYDSTYNKLLRKLTKTTARCLPPHAEYVQAAATALDGFSTGVQTSTGDNVAPFHCNGSYTGANHGWNFTYIVNVPAGHGLSYADIGTLWTDGAGKQFYLVHIGVRYSTTLYFLSKPTGSVTDFVFAIQSLAPMSGDLVQTGGITIIAANYNQTQTSTGSTDGQLRFLEDLSYAQITNQSQRNHTTTILMNNTTAPTVGTTHTCKYVVIKHHYDIINPYSELQAIIANAGHFEANPTWNYSSALASIDQYYVLGGHGECKIYIELTLNQAVVFTTGLMGFTQFGVIYANTALLGAGAKNKGYMPKVANSVTKMNSKLQVLETIGQVIFTADERIAGQIPDRAVQVATKSDDTMSYYQAVGYSLQQYSGRNSARLVNVYNKYWLFSITTGTPPSGKFYPQCYQGKPAMLPAGTYRNLSYVCFKGYTAQNPTGTFTACYWYNESNYAVLYIDYHATAAENLDFSAITGFTNSAWEVIEKSSGFNIANTGVFTSGLLAIDVTVTDDVGEYLVLKVK